MDTQEVLQKCKVEGNVVKLPDVQLERKAYMDVKKSLEGIGGKWKGGKVAGFVFQEDEDPTSLLSEVAGGKKINLKKDYQFFATPAELAAKLVEYACIREGHSILEPSAGQGVIIDAINDALPITRVDCYELMPTNRNVLKNKMMANLIGDDFLKSDPKVKYDRIVANPPFTRDADIDHIRAMYKRLTPNGRLVTIASNSWRIGERKKTAAFRQWLNDLGAFVEPIPMGSFKESGTMVGGVIIIIDKDEE